MAKRTQPRHRIEMSIADLEKLQTTLYDVQTALTNQPALYSRVHELLDCVEGYLSQPTSLTLIHEPEEYHPHLPGMALLIAQAQQQQQQ